MTKHFNFYYDESEHSRRINYPTITAENYYDNFVTVTVGWETSNAVKVEERYIDFENKYMGRTSGGEIKSTTLKQKQLKTGFSSLSRDNTEFVGDLLSLFDDKIFLYFSITSKIEFIINQLFANYSNTILVDTDCMKYSIVKSIVMYQPQEIICAMYENTGELIQLLKNFYRKRIDENKVNPELKKLENETFLQILILLDTISDDVNIDWNYHIAFWGFQEYLFEKGIDRYSLFLDKEGERNNTLKASKQVGLFNVNELDSKDSVGIRMADMLAGVISKLLKALHVELRYKSVDDGINKKILNGEWFCLNEQQLTLYKRLRYVLIELNNAWYKSFAGIYSDDLICFIELLKYVSCFDSVDELNKIDKKLHAEYLNTNTCNSLNDYYSEQFRFSCRTKQE